LATPKYYEEPGGLGEYYEEPSGFGLDVVIGTPLGNQIAKKIDTEVRPKLRAEIDRGLQDAKKTGYVIGALVMASVFAAAWWVKKGK
jgi:hypothetical protein